MNRKDATLHTKVVTVGFTVAVWPTKCPAMRTAPSAWSMAPMRYRVSVGSHLRLTTQNRWIRMARDEDAIPRFAMSMSVSIK